MTSDYPFKTDPWQHQVTEYDLFSEDPARALLWSMRTGKSKAVIDLACKHHVQADLGGAIILAPNGMHVSWIRRQLPVHMWDNVEWQGLAWISNMSARNYYQEYVDDFMSATDSMRILTLNPESMLLDRTKKLVRAFMKDMKGRKTMFVADESHIFRRPGSRRTRLARGLAERCQIKRIMTGTALLNSPLHAFSQFQLLQRGALGHNTYDEFLTAHAVYETRKLRSGRTYPALKEYRDLEGMREKIAQWSSVVLREEANLPELVTSYRDIMPSKAQHEAYQNVVKNWLLELDRGVKVELLESGARIQKMQQILGGFFYAPDGTTVSVDDNPPRLQALIDEVEQTEGKIIIWCHFREDLIRVPKALEKAGISFTEYHGHTDDDIDNNLDWFQDETGPKCMVSQPARGGQGLDMSAADSVFWYSYGRDTIIWDQAMERASKVDGSSVNVVIFVTPGAVDEGIIANHQGKIALADMLTGSGLRKFLSEGFV